MEGKNKGACIPSVHGHFRHVINVFDKNLFSTLCVGVCSPEGERGNSASETKFAKQIWCQRKFSQHPVYTETFKVYV